MRVLPDADPGEPGSRTPLGYLLWLADQQKRSIVAGALFDTCWLLGLMLLPWALGHAIGDGILGAQHGALVRWVTVILVLSVMRAAMEPMRDRAGVNNWMQAAYRSAQLVGHHCTRVGQALTDQKSVGEIASVTNDSWQIGHIYYLTGGLLASVISYAVVSVILLRVSLLMGIVVLVGVPVFSWLLYVLGKPVKRRQDAQRAAAGLMTTLGGDVVAGLRILLGIGGDSHFLHRYRQASATTRERGMAMAGPVALIEALQVAAGGILIVGLTWVGAVQTIHGHLSAGDLVTFYGYAGFLAVPISLGSEAVTAWTRALVSADRILAVLAIEPAAGERGGPSEPTGAEIGVLHDSLSGLRIRPGTTVGIVAADPRESAALLDRIARFDDAALSRCPVFWDERPTTDIPLADIRSETVLVDTQPQFFTGGMRSELDPTGSHEDADILAALHTVCADDILRALPDGLDTGRIEGGRVFSGGQRQRLGLARAVLTDAPMLLLAEPTSAVDAHTETLIADRLLRSRAGRTTVVATVSPLLLSELDTVHLLADGAVAVTGTHHTLMRDSRYRAIVLRGGE